MEKVRGNSGLLIPRQTLKNSKVVNMTPQDVTAWRSLLPMADTGTTAKKIFLALTDCNMVELTPDARYSILELLRPIVQLICQSIKKHYTNQLAPLNEKQITIVNLGNTLQGEMAFGYKCIIEELYQKNSANENRILGNAMQKAIYYLLQIMSRHNQLYFMPPKGTWQELHLIYSLAEQHKLLDNPANKILATYKQAILLALADPYSLRHTDHEAILALTEIWGSYIDILPINNKLNNCYFIDLNSDEPPFNKLAKTHDNIRCCAVHRLLEHLIALQESIGPDEFKAKSEHPHDPEYNINVTLLNTLINKLSNHDNDLALVEATGPVKFAVGLAAVHYFINDQVINNTEDKNTSEIQGFDLSFGTVEETSKTSTTYPSYQCSLLAMANNIVQILWQECAYPAFQAGDIVALEQTVAHWQIGCIVSMQHITLEKMAITLELYPGQPEAIKVQPIKNDNQASYYLRGILIEDKLLTPVLPFKVGSLVEIVRQDSISTKVVLDKQIKASGYFKEFTYKEGNDKPVKTQVIKETAPVIKNPDLPKDETDFDSIWSNL